MGESFLLTVVLLLVGQAIELDARGEAQESKRPEEGLRFVKWWISLSKALWIPWQDSAAETWHSLGHEQGFGFGWKKEISSSDIRSIHDLSLCETREVTRELKEVRGRGKSWETFECQVRMRNQKRIHERSSWSSSSYSALRDIELCGGKHP